MIRLPKMTEYFKREIANSEGTIKNIFLSNSESNNLSR